MLDESGDMWTDAKLRSSTVCVSVMTCAFASHPGLERLDEVEEWLLRALANKAAGKRALA